MWIKKSLLVLSILLALLTAFNRAFVIKKDLVVWTSQSELNYDAAYSTCEFERSLRSWYVCNVTLVSSGKTCSVNATSWGPHDNNYHHRLHYLANDSVLWVQYHTKEERWVELDGMTLYVVRMSDCDVAAVPVHQVKGQFALREAVVNGDRFDLVYKSDDHTVSKITYGVNGTFISGPDELLKVPSFKDTGLSPLVTSDLEVYYRGNKSNPVIYEINNGTASEILNLKNNVSLLTDFSVGNSRLSFCRNETVPKCEMYDSDGKFLFGYEVDTEWKLLATHNTRNGRLVVAVFDVKDKLVNLRIVVVDADGYRSSEFINGDADSFRDYVFLEDDHAICLKIVTRSYTDSDQIYRFWGICIGN